MRTPFYSPLKQCMLAETTPRLTARECSEACPANWNCRGHLSGQSVTTRIKMFRISESPFLPYSCKRHARNGNGPEYQVFGFFFIFLILVVLDTLRGPSTLPSMRTGVTVMNVKVVVSKPWHGAKTLCRWHEAITRISPMSIIFESLP